MEKYITDERIGLQYELVGDYYLIAGDDEPEKEPRPIGIWGQRHLRYIKQNRKALYIDLKMSGKLNHYIADINEEAEKMFSRLVEQMTKQQGIAEQLKVDHQIVWIQKMKNIANAAREIVHNDLIYC